MGKCRCRSVCSTKPLLIPLTSELPSAALCRSNATTAEPRALTETPCSGCSFTPAPSTGPSCGSAKGSWTKHVPVCLFKWCGVIETVHNICIIYNGLRDYLLDLHIGIHPSFNMVVLLIFIVFQLIRMVIKTYMEIHSSVLLIVNN